VLSLVVFGFAVALLVAHLLDGRVPRPYVIAAFIMSAVVAAGDLREYAGQVCTTADAQTVCTARYIVKVEALAALIASAGFAALTLALEVLSRLAGAAGWDV